MRKPEFYSDNPMDYVRVALAIETLAYHNKNYLDRNINDNCKISEEIQALLTAALEHDTHKECEHDWKLANHLSSPDIDIGEWTCLKCGKNKTVINGVTIYH